MKLMAQKSHSYTIENYKNTNMNSDYFKLLIFCLYHKKFFILDKLMTCQPQLDSYMLHILQIVFKKVTHFRY